MISRITIRSLRVDRTERRNHAGSPQRTGKRVIQHCRSYETARKRLRQKIVWRTWPEEVGNAGIDDSASQIAQGGSNHSRNNNRKCLPLRAERNRNSSRCDLVEALKRHATRTRKERNRYCAHTRYREGDCFSCVQRITTCPTHKVSNLKIGARCVDVERMRQMMRADKNITSRKSHITCQFAFDCEVALVGVSVLKVLLHVQRER